MKAWVTAFVLALSLASFAPAFAQDGSVKEKFYNFDDMLIDGEFKRPQGMFENARNKAKFERLLALKKSFLPNIQDSVQEEALNQ